MTDDTITIRLRPEERAQLERIKKFLHLTGYGGDTRTIKACFCFTENVTQRLFGSDIEGLFYEKKP